MASYELFHGDSLDQWITHFSFPPQLKVTLEELGIATVKDLSILYADENMLKVIESSLKAIPYRRFVQAQHFTMAIDSDANKRTKDLSRWITENKLPDSVLASFIKLHIYDLSQLLYYATDEFIQETLSKDVKPIPLRRLKVAIDELKQKFLVDHQNLLPTTAKGEKEGAATMGRRYYSKENEEILNSIYHPANIKCSQCSVCPIQGVRYICTVRKLYNLCDTCESQQIQPYPTIKIVHPQQAPSRLTFSFSNGESHTHSFPITHSTPAVSAPMSAIPPPPPASGKGGSAEGICEKIRVALEKRGVMKPGEKLLVMNDGTKLLSTSKDEATHLLFPSVRVTYDRTLAYWAGFYFLNNDVLKEIKTYNIETVGELGELWYKTPEYMDYILVNQKIEAKEERGKLIRALNDAAQVYSTSTK